MKPRRGRHKLYCRPSRFLEYCLKARGNYTGKIIRGQVVFVRDNFIRIGSTFRFVGKPLPKETMVEFRARYVWA